VGRGIKAPENIPMAEKLAACWWRTRASRPFAMKAGCPWIAKIGASGQNRRPEAVLALGISGAIQHLWE